MASAFNTFLLPRLFDCMTRWKCHILIPTILNKTDQLTGEVTCIYNHSILFQDVQHNRFLQMRGRWDTPTQNHTLALSVKTHMAIHLERQRVNRLRFDCELSGEITVRTRQCVPSRVKVLYFINSRDIKWKPVTICLEWEIKDVASVSLLLVRKHLIKLAGSLSSKQTFASFPYKPSSSHKRKDHVQQNFNTSIINWRMRSMKKKIGATYIHLYKHMCIYTQQKHAFTNLCTVKKHTISGENKLAHALL